MHGDNMNMTSQSENIGISRVPASELERSEKKRSELKRWWFFYITGQNTVAVFFPVVFRPLFFFNCSFICLI